MNRRLFLTAMSLSAVPARAAALKKMPAWRDGLQINRFFSIPRTAPSAFDLEPAWNKVSGGKRICWMSDVINAWNGLQVDDIGGVVYSALAGGHAATEQNGVYKIDLMQDRPSWSVVRESTPFIPRDPAIQNISYFPDGRPTSRHTYYDGHVVVSAGNRLIVFAESLAKTYVATRSEARSVDAFHLSSSDWDLRGGDWELFRGSPYTANCVAKDPRTQRIWVADIKGAIHFLDPNTRKWTFVVGDMNSWGIGSVGSLIDAKRDRFVFAGTHSHKPREQPAFGIWHISEARYEDKALTGEGASRFVKGSYSGLAHDTLHDKFYFLESVSGAVLSVSPDTFRTEFVTQGPRPTNGCLNRFAFISRLGGFMYLPGWNNDVLFLPVT